MPLPEPFSRYRSELEAELKSALSAESLSLYAMMRYHLGWEDAYGQARETSGGKRLRPTLCLTACEAVGGDWHLALPAAAAVELVHNFTLVHDDIEDRSSQRRHQPTVWKVWGIPHGVNVGDGMWAVAQLTLLRLESNGLPPVKIAQMSRLLSDACLRLCEGQYLDLSYQDSFDTRVEDYFKMIEGKTAQLFSCALSLGAIVGTDNQTLISQIGSFGIMLGLSFQIHDDLLGIWAKEETTGKSSLTDIKERKKTLPIIYALEEAKGEDRNTLLSLYRQPRISTKEAADIVRILDNVGARTYVEEFRQKYCDKALESIAEMRLPPKKTNELKEMVTFMLE